MSILADTTLQALIDSYGLIRSRRPINIQPASIEMHLGTTYIDNVGTLDEETVAFAEDPLVIQPGEFLLATTEEYVHIPNWLVGRLEGKSSWAGRDLQSTSPLASSTPASRERSPLSSSTSPSLPSH